MAVIQTSSEAPKGGNTGKPVAFNQPHESDTFKVVKMIMERNFAPVIVFSFSKKDCELFAMQLTKLDFNTGKCIH